MYTPVHRLLSAFSSLRLLRSTSNRLIIPEAFVSRRRCRGHASGSAKLAPLLGLSSELEVARRACFAPYGLRTGPRARGVPSLQRATCFRREPSCTAQPNEGTAHHLELAFESLELRRLCENALKAKRLLGVDVAKALQERLADLHAATSIDDLLIGTPTPLRHGSVQQMAIFLGHGIRLVFVQNHRRCPTLDSGNVDWSQVRRIKIVEIGPGDE